MTPKQIALVQESWNKVLVIGDAAAQLFYTRLFTVDPSLRPMFRGDMVAQGKKLVGMISVAVKGLARLDTLVPAVQALGRRHAGYGVKDEHYATVGGALLWTLEQGLKDDFTPEVKKAWTLAYGLLATTMQDASRTVAKAA
jgi:hemoglobin-like flavoprotein